MRLASKTPHKWGWHPKAGWLKRLWVVKLVHLQKSFPHACNCWQRCTRTVPNSTLEGGIQALALQCITKRSQLGEPEALEGKVPNMVLKETGLEVS